MSTHLRTKTGHICIWFHQTRLVTFIPISILSWSLDTRLCQFMIIRRTRIARRKLQSQSSSWLIISRSKHWRSMVKSQWSLSRVVNHLVIKSLCSMCLLLTSTAFKLWIPMSRWLCHLDLLSSYRFISKMSMETGLQMILKVSSLGIVYLIPESFKYKLTKCHKRLLLKHKALVIA